MPDVVALGTLGTLVPLPGGGAPATAVVVPGVVWAVVGVSLGAALLCLLVAIGFAYEDRKVSEPLRQAVEAAGERVRSRVALGGPVVVSASPPSTPPLPFAAPTRGGVRSTTPGGAPNTGTALSEATPAVQGGATDPAAALGGPVDFEGIAELAQALAKLKPSGQLLVASIVFSTIAMATAVAGLAAG